MKGKRILSLILTLCMLLALTPAMTVPASAETVVEIENYEQLKAFAARVNGGEIHLDAKLTADFPCSDQTWTPIGNDDNEYSGTFNGQGHTITGLSNADVDYSGLSDDDEAYIGLFGVVEGKVQNVVLAGCALSFASDANADAYIGAIAGKNYGTVENCGNTGAVSGPSDAYVGGVVGYNISGTVQNCYNTGAVSGGIFVGGVVGENTGSVKNCLNTGAISGRAGAAVGGIAGTVTKDDTVENCLNTGEVFGSSSAHVGGIVGNNSYGTVKYCLSVGAVSGGTNAKVGGAVGWCPNSAVVTTVKNCYFLDTTAADAVGSAGSATVTNVSALTADELKTLSNCVGFTADNWTEGLSFPVLVAFTAEVHLYANSNEDRVDTGYVCACAPTKIACPFTYADHTFTGWNTKPDGDGTPYGETDAITLKTGETLTLYAQWRDAVVNYPLWVGGVQVTSDNMGNVLGDGTVKFEITDEGENVLTLTNAKIETQNEQDSGIMIQKDYWALTISLIGENEISGTKRGIAWYGGGTDSRLTLTGGGKLKVVGINYGIYVNANLLIDGVSVSATGSNYSSGYGIRCFDLEIKDSIVTANGWVGLESGGSIKVTDSQVFAPGCSKEGIYSYESITIGGDSTLDLEGGYSAIWISDSITLNDGMILLSPSDASWGENGTGHTLYEADGTTCVKKAVFKKFIEYPLWVGGVQVTSANAPDVLGDQTVKFEITEDGENVLTLTNANITGTYLDPDDAAEYTLNLYTEEIGYALTVQLIGENSMRGADIAIQAEGAMQFVGSGTLTAEGSVNGVTVYVGGVTVDGPALTFSGKYFGLWVPAGSITVKNGKLTAEGPKQYAILAKSITLGEGMAITTPTGGYFSEKTVRSSEGDEATKVVIEKAYTVSVTPGANMSISKTAASATVSQTVAAGSAMTAVVFEANDGYYFPTDYSVASVNGISVTRDSFTQITVSGTPTADAAITLTAPTAKNKEQTPTATFTATGADTGTLGGLTAGMKYKVANSEWQTIAGTSVDLTNLSPCTITVYMPGNGTTTIDSDEQTITVTKAATPTLTATQPTTINGTGSIPTTAEHQKSTDGTTWEDCTGAWENLEANKTYYVRVKASGTVLASDAQGITINAFIPGKEQTPQAIFTATGADTGTLSNVAAGMKYKIDSGEWQTVSGTSVELTNLAPCMITVYMPGNGTTTIDSDEQTITVTKAATPTLEATQPATINDKGAIPTTTAHQKSVNGTDWEECDGMWTDLDEGTYYVRVKAAGTVLTSDVQEIVIAVARYTVKFVDEDGTELQSTVYACGETPVYNGENPTKEATAENTYTFAGWTPDIVPVAGDATYTAKYDATVNEYTVTFETNGGSDVPAVKVKYGDPVAEPDAPEKKSFAFAGWYADEGLETPYDFTAKITADTKIYAKWTPISYPVFSGEDSEWTKGSDKDVVITVKRSDADDTCLDHFIGVEIDGNPLERDVDYTAAKGSVVITLKAATLEKLSVGEHTVTVIFDDGRVDTKLTIKAAPNNDPVSPQTGDNSHIGLWIALMVISFCGLSATLVIGKKKRVSGK